MVAEVVVVDRRRRRTVVTITSVTFTVLRGRE
jgi:hypothetical protein